MTGEGPLRALELHRSLPRYLAGRAVARGLGSRLPSAAVVATAPLRLTERARPAAPGPDWVRLRPRLAGICGSDLATLTGRSSLYFSALVSFPFVLGHEVVADLLDDVPGGPPAGTRVVLDPVLACAARGLPACGNCAAGTANRCDRVLGGHLAPGMQTGYCADTGGGWSQGLVAHPSQLHPVEDALPDDRAVLVEPLACAVRTARRAAPGPAASVLVVGAGSVGLFTVLALRALTGVGELTVVARYRHQAELARRLGASLVVPAADAIGAVRRSAHALRGRPERGGDFLLGGVDVAIDAAGNPGSLSTALRATRAGGRVVLAGMPPPVDLAPAWFRELEVVGTYASTPADFRDALGLAAQAELDGVVVGHYRLERYAQALDHALAAGRLGAVKVVFDPRQG